MKLINPQDSGASSGSSVILTTVQTRTQGSYAATWNATDGDGTDPSITPLAMTCTPQSSDSTLLIEWLVNGEYDNTEGGLITKKGGVILTDSTDGTNGWSCQSAFPYDVDSTHTLQNVKMSILDATVVAGVAVTYTCCVRNTLSSTYSYYLNRPVNSAGASAYETTVSMGKITEIFA